MKHKWGSLHLGLGLYLGHLFGTWLLFEVLWYSKSNFLQDSQWKCKCMLMQIKRAELNQQAHQGKDISLITLMKVTGRYT